MTEAADAPAHHLAAELVCVGLATLDTIAVVPSWPQPDGRLVVDRLHRAHGGPAATAAVAAARLGARVAFVGAVGDDAAGGSVVAALDAGGVDVGAVAVRSGPTSQSVILVAADGSRSILHAPGVVLDRLDAGQAGLAEAASWVHVDHAGYAAASQVPSQRLSVDAGNPVAGLELRGIGLYAPTAAALAERYPGRSPVTAVAAALRDGARCVVVTLGGEGAIAADADGAWRVRGVQVEVTSTLGAGDVFHGALLASMIGGAALGEALRRANAAAALSCRGLDARSAIPSKDELDTVLADLPPADPISLEEDE